ncbi:MAG: hypothetical protein LBQ49_02655 [Rickettsiales bacterium]|nr:hypothetical protein [Rickettsiales bacterium]
MESGKEILPKSPKLTGEYVAAVEDLMFDYPKMLDLPTKWEEPVKNMLVQIVDYPLANHLTAYKLSRIADLNDAAGVLISGGPSAAYKKFNLEFLACNTFAAWNRFQFGDQGLISEVFMPFGKKGRAELRRPAAELIWERFKKKEAPLTVARLKAAGKVVLDTAPVSVPEFFLHADGQGTYDKFFKGPNRADGLVIIAAEISAKRIYLTASHVLKKFDIPIKIIPVKEVQIHTHPSDPYHKDPEWWNFKFFGPRWMESEILAIIKYGYTSPDDLSKKYNQEWEEHIKKYWKDKNPPTFKPKFRFPLDAETQRKLQKVMDIRKALTDSR